MASRTAITAAAILILVLASSAWAVGPTVTNVQARQWQDDTRKVEISYTLIDPDSATVFISVAVSNDGGSTYAITPTSVTGDIGWVRPGARRTVIWDAKADYPTAVWSSCRARIRADDSAEAVHPGEMVYIPAGSFLMGNNGAEPYSYPDEFPQHSVYLSGYWIGKCEVTRGEYRAFMNAGGYSNPAYWSTDGWNWRVMDARTEPWHWAAEQDWGTGTFAQTEVHPVVGVSYYEAEAFCNWKGGRLPTEAEWEKAARWTGNHPNVYPWGDVWDEENCNNWYDDLWLGCQTSPVGSYPSGASPSGCFDIAGNTFEWIRDRYSSTYYAETPTSGWIDPRGPTSGSYRLLRGGFRGYFETWDSFYCRCAARVPSEPNYSYSSYGFRLVRQSGSR